MARNRDNLNYQRKKFTGKLKKNNSKEMKTNKKKGFDRSPPEANLRSWRSILKNQMIRIRDEFFYHHFERSLNPI